MTQKWRILYCLLINSKCCLPNFFKYARYPIARKSGVVPQVLIGKFEIGFDLNLIDSWYLSTSIRRLIKNNKDFENEFAIKASRPF